RPGEDEEEIGAAPAGSEHGPAGGFQRPARSLHGGGGQVSEPEQTLEPEPAPVPYEEVVKGYEVAPDRYVMVTPEELTALRLEADRIIAIEEFVDLAEIDPIYFEKSYYVAPDRGPGAGRPYGLLLRALEAAGKVGIGRF